jgi:hypothetical protein
MPVSKSRWRPMSTAPRNGEVIRVKRTPPTKPAPPRRHHEHDMRWEEKPFGGLWISLTSSGLRLRDEECAGWKPRKAYR